MTRAEGRTDKAPSPGGPYSQAVRVGQLVAVSGQVGIDPATGKLAGDDVGAQTTQTFANIAAALATLGAGLDDVVRVDVFLASMEDFAAMNERYREAFTAPFPARTTVGVQLAPGMKVEIAVLAALAG